MNFIYQTQLCPPQTHPFDTPIDERHNLLFNYCNLLFLYFYVKNVILDLGDFFFFGAFNAF